MADERNPMPKAAKAAFDKAIILDPKDPRSRYFLAVSKDLDGDHKGAINDWLELLKDTPKDAPWENDLIRTVEQVGKIHKIDITDSLASTQKIRASDLSGTLKSIAAAPIPGPSKTDMAQAAKLPPGKQQQMVTSMVEGLETKLAKNPKNVDGWIMLMRSRMTLGETAKAKAALTKSVASNPESRTKLLKEVGGHAELTDLTEQNVERVRAGIVQRVTSDVKAFIGDQPPHDDITLITILKK